MAAKSDPRRRSPASRPGKAGDSGRGRRSANSYSKPAAKPVARPSSKPTQTAPDESRAATRSLQEHVVEPIKRSFTESVDQRSDQRLGFTARRAAILAAVMCVLTLTIAGPVRTYFAQRTEMEQLSASEAALRRQIAELEQRKGQLADPAYIAAQARERLGFVKPGDIPFQVQLPPGAATPQQPGTEASGHAKNEPWYTALWHTIADAPHLPPGANPAPEPAPVPPNPTTPGG
ncbi:MULTISPECIES: FtsB family cell division protein [Mycobacterium]|uniref:Membrane protein n=1 Tax=Mycobacterium kiyosense TaxID=2871094 RepID=A0A9P3Q8R3_9MYCO|nr:MULTISPECIES: septum formation initiator family protein [Mycobacterium]BDE16181.1 membrane protein [Mycobacterium sp. 20KCMC460]GLB82148.1 membrane protein [Mycobacterium kiyosense]GLB90561.1 membrane protein [Mycobacterium kiyosense]GLB95290.1 membrane protein [Mycobacterium kiyosense]GLC00237.1 membrane protein [Mycobacterium kiyosense]